MREPNILLDALIDEAGMSHDGFAARVNQAGKRHGLVLLYDHASVRRWIRDATVPRGRVPDLICEILSARLGRTVTLTDAGLDRYSPEDEGAPLAQAADAATALCGAATTSGPLHFTWLRQLKDPPPSRPCTSGRIRRTTWTYRAALVPG